MKKNNKLLNVFMIVFLVFFALNTFVFAAGSNDDFCSNNNYADVLKDLQNVFDFAKIIIPLLIIGFSSYEFIKALAGKEAKDVKKAFTRFLKRLVLAVVFFFLPALINMLLKLMEIDSSSCLN